jgi:hypothetical protein
MRQRGINVSSFAHRKQRAAASELEVWRRQCPKLLRVVGCLPMRAELAIPGDVSGQASDKPQGRKPRERADEGQ